MHDQRHQFTTLRIRHLADWRANQIGELRQYLCVDCVGLRQPT
jgi:hypothetical protein